MVSGPVVESAKVAPGFGPIVVIANQGPDVLF